MMSLRSLAAFAAIVWATFAGIALAQFPEPAGKIEIVQAKATKYAWIAENAEYVFDKIRPMEGSAFLVVEIKANVAYDESGSLRSNVVIESAKGNQRGPIFGIADHGNLTTDEYIWDSAFDQKGKTRRKVYRFVFVVPEQTAEATLVLQDERTKLEFAGEPTDYPPIGGGPMQAEILSTKFVDAIPKPSWRQDEIVVERSPGASIAIPKKQEPDFDRFVAVEIRVAPKDPDERFIEDSYHFQRSDFVAVFDDGVAYRTKADGTLAGQAGEDGTLEESSGTFYFPVPAGATKGTVYLRQQPIAEFEVPK